MLRYLFLFLIGYVFYKFFKSLVEKKQTPVKGSKNDQESFQQKYKDLIEDADFEELDGDKKD
ncbi:hypothetical protein ACX8XP_02855 [Calditrichota bacterium LG25]